MTDFSRTARVGFAKPDTWNVEIPFENATAPHAVLLQNFVNAILDGEPLIAPGAEGLHSVELANVMLHSSALNQTVELPLDGRAFELKLQEWIAASRTVKQVVEIKADDFTQSFHR